MSSNEELKQVTKLVLYGWGYPDLFSQPNGDRFQNRLVSFPPNAAPTIAGANQTALKDVRSRLKIVKKRHQALLKSVPSNINPVWVWVDTPRQLSYLERLAYREQFESWLETTEANNRWNDLWFNLNFLPRLKTQASIMDWKRKAIALVILTGIALVIIGVQ